MTIKLSDYCSSARLSNYVHEPPRSTPAPCYAAHFQLRDLIASPAPGKIVAANGSSVHGLTFPQSPSSQSSDITHARLFRTPFVPVCLAQGCGLFAVGGQSAELAVRSYDSQHHHPAAASWAHANFRTGESINNSITIVPRPGSSAYTRLSGADGTSAAAAAAPRVITSNNDESIGIWDVLPNHDQSDQSTPSAPISLKHRTSIRPPVKTPINHCSVSKDGRFLTAVGDTSDVYFYSCPTNPQEDKGYKLLHTVKASDDAAFSVDWSRDNNTCAVAAQDGVVSIFDVRCLRSGGNIYHNQPNTVATYKTARYSPPAMRHATQLLFGGPSYGTAGAARCIKFSPGRSSELLAFTEQSKYVNIVDGRSLDPSTLRSLKLPEPQRQSPTAVRRAGIQGPGEEDDDEENLSQSSSAYGLVLDDEQREAQVNAMTASEIEWLNRDSHDDSPSWDNPPEHYISPVRNYRRRRDQVYEAVQASNARTATPRPCLAPSSPSRAPLLDLSGDNEGPFARPSSTGGGPSLHTWCHDDDDADRPASPSYDTHHVQMSDLRTPPWRRHQAEQERRGMGDMPGPVVLPGGELSLGLRQRWSVGGNEDPLQTLTTSAGRTLLRSTSTLSAPGWADISANDPHGISGMSWDPRGEKLYVATSTATYEYSVNMLARGCSVEATCV